MIRILFLVIATLGVLTALGTVLARNLVHAALFLVAFFFLIACQFVLLEADLLAAIQVLVYIGAVAILLLFGIMLTRNILGDETTEGSRLRLIPAAIVTLAVLALLIVGIQQESGLSDRPAWSATRARPDLRAAGASDPDDPAADPRASALSDMAQGIGVEMMTRYVVAFEVAGLLLTAAIVGAIALAVGDRGGVPPSSSVDGRAEALAPGGDGRGDLPGEPHLTAPDVPTTPASAPR